MSERTRESSVSSIPSSSTPLHENARECTVSTDCDFSPPQLNTPCPERAQRVEGPTRALTQRHRTALDMLVGGKSDYEVCFTLKIHSSTLYRWKHHNPIFVAELNRRHQELWTDLAADLRLTVAKAIRTIDLQLHGANDLSRHRAARSLINLVNTDRLSPKNAPTRVEDVLDVFLRKQQPQAAPKSDGDAPASFTRAQRHALLDQILAEEAQAEADLNAAAAQRSALYQQRRAQSKTSTSQPPTPEAP